MWCGDSHTLIPALWVQITSGNGRLSWGCADASGGFVGAVATRERLCEGGKRNEEVGALRISGVSLLKHWPDPTNRIHLHHLYLQSTIPLTWALARLLAQLLQYLPTFFVQICAAFRLFACFTMVCSWCHIHGTGEKHQIDKVL